MQIYVYFVIQQKKDCLISKIISTFANGFGLVTEPIV